MRVGIIVGSIRDGRKGRVVGEWVHAHASARDDAEFTLIDLMTFNVPLLTARTLPAAARKRYDSAEVTAWSVAIDACDAFVFVTAEYNHGVPGAFKNAYDVLGNEWLGKPVAFVSYGAAGGVRSVENWRTIVANFQQFDVRAQVSLSTFQDFDGASLTPQEHRPAELTTLLDQLIDITARLRPSP